MLIDVLIYSLACCTGNTKPRQVVQQTCQGRGSGAMLGAPLGMAPSVAGASEHIEFLCPAHGRTAVVHPELAVNVIGVRTQGVQGHH